MSNTVRQPSISLAAAQIHDITNTGAGLADVGTLPNDCYAFIANKPEGLDTAYHQAYIKAMRMFAALNTPMRDEALTALAENLTDAAYPPLGAYDFVVQTPVQRGVLNSLQDIQRIYGNTLPAAFYRVVLNTAFQVEQGTMLPMFKDMDELLEDRIMDAALHAVLLVTPVGLHIQSLFSQNGVRFSHVMNCGCITQESKDAPFYISEPTGDEKVALMQNVIAATLEQYGVNAVTMNA